MKLKLNAVAAALAFIAAGGAHAEFNQPPTGNGTLLFIAIDADANIAFTADLGLTVTSFTEATTFTSGLGAPVSWNFATNDTNSGIVGTNAWSAAYSTFAATQTGGNFQWGVIAGDNISGTVAGSAFNRNLLATGNVTQAQMLNANTSTPTSTALTALGEFTASVNNFGNLAAANTNGAATTTSANGVAYLNNFGGIADNFQGQLTWRYLLDNGMSSTFQRQQQASNPLVTQFGNPNAVDSLSASPITFTFDIATNTLTLAPIPEPGTYAMLLAGMAAVGFMARRRKA